MYVPDDMGNRHRVEVQEWIDEPNTPDAWDPYDGQSLADSKTAKIMEIKRQGRSKMANETDWYIVREAELATAVPANITTYRADIKTEMDTRETAINAETTNLGVWGQTASWPTTPAGI